MITVNTVYSPRRKTMCIKIARDGSVTVHVPPGTSHDRIQKFVKDHEKWIITNSQKLRLKNELVTNADAQLLRKQAKEYILPKVKYYSEIMGLYPEGVKITSAKGRYGSCSGKNSLCFSLYVMLCPKEAVDYVIVHELAHIKEKNHSKRFYALVEKYMPDYKERVKLIKK